MKETANTLIKQLESFIKDVENKGYTNEQWFINFEDTLNKLSIKDHSKI